MTDERLNSCIEAAWGLTFGGGSLLCLTAAIASAIFFDWQHVEALLLFAILALLLGRGDE